MSNGDQYFPHELSGTSWTVIPNHALFAIPVTPPHAPKDPCPCGSGKKYRKCHGAATSPRINGCLVEFPAGPTPALRRIDVDPATGVVRFVDEALNPLMPEPWFAFVLGYEGKKGFRAIVAIPNVPDGVATSVQAALDKFDLLVCVDSSWEPNTKHRSVTSAMVLGRRENGRFFERSEFSIEVIDRASHANAEAIGIVMTADILETEYPDARRVGIVTDYDAKKILIFNKRLIAVAGNFLPIPRRCELIYASDATRDTEINVIMACVNKRVQELRELLTRTAEQTGDRFWRQDIPGAPFKRWRRWRREEVATPSGPDYRFYPTD
jgi:hypothetical protein